MSTLRMTVAAVVLVCCRVTAAEPATTQTAGDVVVTVRTIDTKPTLISGKFTDVPAAKLFDQIADRAGAQIFIKQEALDDPQVANAVFSAEFDHQRLWDVLHEACEATGLTPQVNNDSRQRDMITIGRGEMRAPWLVDGPVAIQALSIQRSAAMDYAAMKPRPQEVRVTLQTWPEPKLGRLLWTSTASADEAEDEAGHSLLPPPSGAENPGRRMLLGMSAAHGVSFALSYPPNAAKVIALLRGHVSLRVAKEVAKVEIARPLEREQRTFAVGRNEMLLRVKKRENGDSSHYRFEFVIKRKDQSDERWRDLAENFGRLQAVAKLITSKGESSSPRSGGSFNDSEAMFGTDFSDADDAKLLRVEFPQELQTLDAKFEFKDLPLP